MEAGARRLAPITRERSRTLRRNPTDAEPRLWSALRRKSLAGSRFRRQHPLGEFFADFAALINNSLLKWTAASRRRHRPKAHEISLVFGLSRAAVLERDVLTNLEGGTCGQLPILTFPRN